MLWLRATTRKDQALDIARNELVVWDDEGSRLGVWLQKWVYDSKLNEKKASRTTNGQNVREDSIERED